MGAIGPSLDFPRRQRPDPFWGRVMAGAFLALGMIGYALARAVLIVVLALVAGCAVSRQGIVLGDAKIEQCVESLERRERVCTTTSGGHIGEPFVSLLTGTAAAVRRVVGLP